MTFKERLIWGLVALAIGIGLMVVLPHEQRKIGTIPVFIYMGILGVKGTKKKDDHLNK